MYSIHRLLFITLFIVTAACGKSENSEQDNSSLTQEPIFRVLTDSNLRVQDSQDQEVDLQLSANDHIVVVDSVPTAGDEQKRIAIAIDRNDDASSEIFFVPAEELLALPISIITIENDEDWAMGEEQSSSSDAFIVDIAGIQKAIPFVRVARMTYCYRYVKKYLLKVGLVKVYLPGASAYQAATILPKHGFKKVSRKPSQAIVNDVCVYKGGPAGHGHIEIKTSKGWYYGYGYKSSPIKNRIFIGCYHK